MPENDFLDQSPEDFLDRSPDDFLKYDPAQFLAGEQQVIEETKKENSHLKTELAIAVGIGVSFLVWRAIAKRKLQQQKPESKDEAYAALKAVWGQVAPVWLQIATPAIAAAYQVGSQQVQVSDRQLESIAREYSAQLGRYIGATSDNAVLEGFADQLNKKVNPSVAWERATEGYGLDRKQMRGYVMRAGSPDDKYQPDAVAGSLKKTIDKMLHGRADRVARHEAWAAMTMGKNVMWMHQQELGILPPGTKKQWITAKDELVCPVCAPLDRKEVLLDAKFETPQGGFWTPAVHINCRCDIRLILPDEEVEKAWDESLYRRGGNSKNRGQFSSKPKNKKLKPFKEAERPVAVTKPNPEYAKLSEYLNDVVQKEPSPFDSAVKSEKTSPFANKSPFSNKAESPFKQKAESPFTSHKPFDNAVKDPFTQQTPFQGKPKRKVVTTIIVTHNGKKTPQKVEYDIPPNEEPYVKNDQKVAFVPYFGFKSRFQGRDHSITNPWSANTEQVADIDYTDIETGSIPIINNAYVENSPVELTGDNFAYNDIPEALKLAVKDSVAQANDWLLEERAAYERDVIGDPDFDDDYDDGSTIGPTNNTYNFTPAVVGFSDFYSVNAEEADSNVAGKYKIRMAEPSAQEGEVYNDALTQNDENKLTFRMSVKDFRDMYDDLSHSKIRWEGSSHRAVYDKELAYEFPELFFSNPWSDDRWVTVVYAQPVSPPVTEY
jgi:hypothetical protein